MNRLRIALMALMLGLPAAASADDSAWGTAPSRPPSQPSPAAGRGQSGGAPAVQLGRPVIAHTAAPAAGNANLPMGGGRGANQEIGVPGPAVLLERPRVAGCAAPVADPLFRPASFEPVVRGQAPDTKPLPTGPTPSAGATPSADAPVVSQNWVRTTPDQVVSAPPGVMSAPPGIVGPIPDGAPAGGCGCGCDSCGACCGGACGGCGGGFWSLFHGGLFGCSDACGCDASAACDGACGCGCGSGGPDDPLRNHLYVSAEYLAWWTRGSVLPPLITQGSVADEVNTRNAGAIGAPGTVNLFGGADYNTAAHSGGRLMAGWWFGDDHCLGIEAGGFFLSQESHNFSATSPGTPILARPFFDLATGASTSQLISAPGLAAGTATGSIRNDLWGAEANLRSNLWCGPWETVDLIAGYRHLSLNETLDVGESISGVGTAAGFAFTGNDQFAVHNSFNGGQIGFDAETHLGRWYVDLNAKVALGSVNERLIISGSTTSSLNGVPLPVPPSGALLTAGRVGTYNRNVFAWSPDIGVKLGYNLTDHWRVFVGYDFLFLSDVIRAGDQVDLRVNGAFATTGAAGGPATPPVVLHGSDFWAQGVNLGLEFRW